MEKWDELTPERRQNMINQLKGLIEQGEKAFEDVPTTL
jgi:ribosome recycling factor